MLFNLHNLENVLQRNLRTDTARECIFRASGGTRFKISTRHGGGKGEGGFQDVTVLPKNTLHKSLGGCKILKICVGILLVNEVENGRTEKNCRYDKNE